MLYLCIGEYRGPRISGAFFGYVDSKIRRVVTEYTWMTYVASQLRLQPQGQYNTFEWKPQTATKDPQLPQKGSVIKKLVDCGIIEVI